MKAPYVLTRKYYKYITEANSTPVFIENNQVVDEMSISQSSGTNVYKITGTSTTTFSRNITITVDCGPRCKEIVWVGYNGVVSSGNYPGFSMRNIACSEDGETWTSISSAWGGRNARLTSPLQIPIPNNYRYLKFTSYNDDSAYGAGGINSFKVGFNVNEEYESTESDYDFYEDVLAPKIVKDQQDSIYKTFKSYEKGQYYGN